MCSLSSSPSRRQSVMPMCCPSIEPRRPSGGGADLFPRRRSTFGPRQPVHTASWHRVRKHQGLSDLPHISTFLSVTGLFGPSHRTTSPPAACVPKLRVYFHVQNCSSVKLALLALGLMSLSDPSTHPKGPMLLDMELPQLHFSSTPCFFSFPKLVFVRRLASSRMPALALILAIPGQHGHVRGINHPGLANSSESPLAASGCPA